MRNSEKLPNESVTWQVHFHPTSIVTNFSRNWSHPWKGQEGWWKSTLFRSRFLSSTSNGAHTLSCGLGFGYGIAVKQGTGLLVVVVDRSHWTCLANVNERLHGSEHRGVWESSFGFLCWCVLFWFPHFDLCCGWAGLRSWEGKEGDTWSLCNVCTLCKCDTFNFFYFQDV